MQTIVFDSAGVPKWVCSYDLGSAPDPLPPGEVEASIEQFDNYLNYRLVDGEIVLLDENAIAERARQASAASERAWRDAELDGNQWLTARHRDEQDLGTSTTLTAEQFAGLLTYRQLLRDWPESPGFPDSGKRPAAPDWLAAALIV